MKEIVVRNESHLINNKAYIIRLINLREIKYDTAINICIKRRGGRKSFITVKRQLEDCDNRYNIIRENFTTSHYDLTLNRLKETIKEMVEAGEIAYLAEDTEEVLEFLLKD